MQRVVHGHAHSQWSVLLSEKVGRFRRSKFDITTESVLDFSRAHVIAVRTRESVLDFSRSRAIFFPNQRASEPPVPSLQRESGQPKLLAVVPTNEARRCGFSGCSRAWFESCGRALSRTTMDLAYTSVAC